MPGYEGSVEGIDVPKDKWLLRESINENVHHHPFAIHSTVYLYPRKEDESCDVTCVISSPVTWKFPFYISILRCIFFVTQ